jgi:hypothetical protein
MQSHTRRLLTSPPSDAFCFNLREQQPLAWQFSNVQIPPFLPDFFPNIQ